MDQVFSFNDSFINDINYFAPLGKSDHVSIKIELKVNNSIEFLSSMKQNWYKIDSDFVLTHSKNVDWNYSNDRLDVESMWSESHTKLTSICDSVPTITLKTTRDGHVLERLPWDCSMLIRKRKHKDRSWRSFESNPSLVTYSNAMFQQQQYQKAEVKAKVKFENKLVKNLKSNSKPFFKYLKSKNKVNKSVSGINCSDGSSTVTPKDTADALADFFESVFTIEPYGPLPRQCYQRYTDVNMDMDSVTVDHSTVIDLLKNLDCGKAMGPDNIHPKLLKYFADDLSFVKAISELFNKCIAQECIPTDWKSAVVIPLHKKGSVHSANNYRPVSLTCIVCKMYEKLLRQPLLEHVSHCINVNQHGFTKGKSCLSNLLETIDTVNDYLSEGNCADILYFDFSKAFDSVPHHRLVTKLANYGIPESMLNIIRDFLTDRTMVIKVGDALSSTRNVSSGVPQGSVLGPLLFLLFINDIPEGIRNMIKIFADDVKLVANPLEYDFVIEDLEALSSWEQLWQLTFNLEKCKVMYLGSENPHTRYVFGGTVMPVVEEEKDLGVTFNNSYDFTNHISVSIAKANRIVGWISRTIVSREPEVMVRIYKSLVRPHLEYCTQVWAPVAKHGNCGMIDEIENVQRSFTRMIEGIGLLTYRERLHHLKLTTLLERRMRGDLIETFKVVNGYVNYGSNFFNHSRSGRHLVSKLSTANLTHNKVDFFAQRVLTYWNKLPAHVRNSPSINSFKNSLDLFRERGIRRDLHGNFWELSDELFNRIDVSAQARQNYSSYMKAHPYYAKYRKVNIK